MKHRSMSRLASLVSAWLAVSLIGACAAAAPTTQPSGEQPSPSSSAGVQPTGGPTATSGTGEDVVLRVAYPTDPKSFNGILQNFSYTAQVMIQMFNRLLAYDAEYNVIPDLAETWEVSDDGTRWEFHLREDVAWHDGVPFTSADVAFHYGKVQELSTTPGGVAVKNALESIETPDDYTVIFNFSAPVHINAFLDLYADTFILPKHVFEEGDFENHPNNLLPVGTGPFKFVEYDPNVSLELEANDDYFGGRPAVDRLVYQILAEAPAALLALRRGQVDVIEMTFGIPPSEVPNLQADPALDADSFPYYTTGWLAFNSREEAVEKHPWLADDAVRDAIILGIDRDFIVERVLGNVTTKVDTIISDTIGWAHNPDVQMPGFDPAAAAAALDAAGYPVGPNGTRFTIDMPVPMTGGLDAAAEAIVEMMRNIGIEVVLDPIELSAFIETYLRGENGLGDSAATVISGGTGPDPTVVRTWYDSNRTPSSDPPGFNFYHFGLPEADRLLAEAENAFTEEAAAPIFRELQAVVAEDSRILPLFNRYQIEAWSRRFTGFRETHRPIAWFASYAGITPAE